MDVLNRMAIFIAIGCLVFVLYDANRPKSFSDEQKAQIEEIIANAIQDDLSAYSSELEKKTERVLEESGAVQSLELKKENVDRLVMDGMRIASDAQGWKRKPAAFGGGREREDGYAALTLEQMGYPVEENGKYKSTNGTCELASGSAEQLQIDCANEMLGNLVQITLSGPHSTDIDTKIVNTAK